MPYGVGHQYVVCCRVGETYLVGADGERSNLSVVREILRAFGRDEGDFDWVSDRPGHDRRYATGAAKLRRELGWEPVHTDFAKGLAETVAWCRDNEAWWLPWCEGACVADNMQRLEFIRIKKEGGGCMITQQFGGIGPKYRVHDGGG